MASTDTTADATNLIPKQNHEVLEAVLYASLLDQHKDQLIERLKGMTDPVSVAFVEHEMVFSMKSTEGPDVQLRLRRRFNLDLWHLRYIGSPISDDKLPAVCRSSINSVMYTRDMMRFVKNLGFRLVYELVLKGAIFTRGPIKVLVYKPFTTDQPGNYSNDLLKPLGDCNVAEASLPVENEETMKYSKLLKDFTDQFMPLVEFRKVEYWRPPKDQVAQSQ